MARTLATGLASALLALASPAARAQGYPTKTIGSWTIAVSGDGDGCFVTRNYDGPGGTTLMLGLDAAGSNHLTVLNDNWSIAPRDRLSLEFRLSSGGYADHPAVGLSSNGKRGFAASFEARFPAYFAASKRLDIYRGRTPVEQLALDGSGAAVAELRRCAGAKTAPGAAAPRAAKIPADPFAPEPERKRRR